MKRIIVLLLTLALLTVTASASGLSDATGTVSQERSFSVEATWMDEDNTPYEIEAMPADQLTLDLVADAFKFVNEEGNRPYKWFPEETQKQIEAIVSNPDALKMNEFMRTHAAEAEVPGDLDAVFQFVETYEPGEPAVVVLGLSDDSGEMTWTALEATVTEVGNVEVVVPQETMEALQGSDVQVCMLGSSGSGSFNVVVEEKRESKPSKTAEDVTRIEKIVFEGDDTAADFSMNIAPETELIRRELEMIGAFVNEQNEPAMKWMPADVQEQAQYILGTDTDSLIISDYAPLSVGDYPAGGGDAVVSFSFAAPYEKDQPVVAVVGTPNANASEEGTQMNWVAQPVTVRDDGTVDVIFNRLALIEMGKETGLLLVFSAPVAE